jgi:hypothetical protein
MTQTFCSLLPGTRTRIVVSVLFGLVGCGADTGGGAIVHLDGGVQDAAVADAEPVLDSFFSTEAPLPPAPTDALVDAQPTISVEPSIAFAEISGSYAAKGANISGSGSTFFDNGQTYNFTITADGTATFNSKTVPQVFSWAKNGKRIVRNTKNNVTVIEMEEATKRIVTITYHPANGPFDIAGVFIDPAGRWYLSGIVKM